MLKNNKYFFDKIKLINFFISLIPLTLIIGNLAINLIIIIISIIGLYIFGNKVFIIKDKTYQFLIYAFFFYLIITTFFNNWLLLDYNEIYLENFIKSLLYLRFLILFLVVNKLIERDKFDLSIFIKSCALFAFLVSIDVIFQFIFKVNILGYPIINNKASSFFGEEHIAGSYLQKFVLFLIFYILFKIKNKNNFNYLIIFLFIIFFIPIILTGNKMPAIIYLGSLILFFLLEKKLKLILLVLFMVFFLIFSFKKIIPNNRLGSDINLIINDAKYMLTEAPRLFLNKEPTKPYSWRSGYLIHFNSGIQVYKNNILFGQGLKSFRLNCKYDKYQTCNTHPHNYLIELLVETGLVGATCIYLIFILGSINFIRKNFKNKNIYSRLISTVFFLLIFFEFFPFRTTGSFFTTYNSIFLYLILPFFLNYKNKIIITDKKL